MAGSRRDEHHRGYDTAYLLAPVAPAVIAGLPDALRRLVRDDFMGYAGRRWPAGSTAEPDVLHLPDGLDDRELILRVRADGYRGTPIAVGVSGDRVAILVPHGLADGTESVVFMQGLLLVAAGGEPPAVAEPVRFPVLRAIRSTGWRPFRTFVQHRRAQVEAQVGLVTAAPPMIATVTVTGDRLTAVKRGRNSGGRATISTRLASIAISTLLATAHDDRPAELVVPFDLRHAAGGRVSGNFVHAEVLGLLDAGWAPGTLSAALAARREILVPAMVYGLLRPRMIATRNDASWSQRLGVGVSMMQVPDLPESLWADGERRFVCVSVSESSSLLVVVATARDAAYVSIYDATGWIDTSRFAAEFLKEIDARMATRG